MSILRKVLDRMNRENGAAGEHLVSAEGEPAKLYRAFVISRMPNPYGAPGETRITGSDVLADEHQESLIVPEIPENYVLAVGDITNPDQLRYYRRANEQDSKTAQEKRNELIDSSRMITMTNTDRKAVFFNLIPRNNGQIVEKLNSSKLVSASRITSYARSEGNQVNSLEEILARAVIDPSEITPN